MVEIEKPRIECIDSAEDTSMASMLLNPWRGGMVPPLATL